MIQLAPGTTRMSRRRPPLALMAVLAVTACTLITPYDPTSYQHATNLKVEALLLIEKANDPPDVHRGEIEAFRTRLLQAYEYERGKGDPNRITVEQWRRLADPDGGLMGGFVSKWLREKRGQSEAFRQGVSKNVGDAFDQIIKLESAKVKN